MGKIKNPDIIIDVPNVLVDLLARIEIIERSLKIRTLTEQETMPVRSCLKKDLDVVNDGL